jgi:hypothetical protein
LRILAWNLLLLFIYSLNLCSFDQREEAAVAGDAVVVVVVEAVEGRRLLFQDRRLLFMEARRLRFLLPVAQEVVECVQEIGGHLNPTGVRVDLLPTVAD